MSASTKRPADDKEKMTSSAERKKKILIAVILVALVVAVAVILIVFAGGKLAENVPNSQDGTTIITKYYENGVLPTSGDKHDVTVIEGGGTSAAELEGIWKLDEITVYEFDGRDRGIMLTAVDNYTFVYSAQDGKLNIDFDYDGATDSEYTYAIDGDKLTMSRSGMDYELTKSDTP